MIKKIRRWYWIFSSFLNKYRKIILLGFGSGALVVIISPILLSKIQVRKNYVIGRIGFYTITKLPIDIQNKVSYGLTNTDTSGQVQTKAALTIGVSPDNKTYTITLNPNITWPNGAKLTSSDINYDIPDLITTKPSDESIAFTLNEPFSPFLAILAKPIFKQEPGKWPFRRLKVLGLNGYVISEIDTKDQLIRSMKISNSKEIITYVFYPTEADAIVAFKLGKIDYIEGLNTKYLDAWPNVYLETQNNSNRFLSLFFNTKDPKLQDKTMRQLLNYATIKNFDGYTRVISPISVDSWAYNPQVKQYDYNPDTARAMIKKIKESNSNQNFNFEITTTPNYIEVADQIAIKWNELGIQTKTKVVPYPDPNDYQVLLIGQEVPNDPDQYALWHSTQTSNITHYQNPKIDKLLEDGRQEFDSEKRKLIYHDFQRSLVEDSPVVYLYQLPFYKLSRGN